MGGRRRAAALLVAGLLVLGVACGKVPGGSPDTLGFLERYEELEPGGEGRARLLFIDPAADFSTFEAILIEPVVGWGGGAEAVGLARHFDVRLREELAQEFAIVAAAQPGTLRLRAVVALKTPSLLAVEVELLDASSGSRVVAAVDEQAVSSSGHERSQARREAELSRWAALIRARLAAFRSFDAAHQAGDAEAAR